MSDLLDRVAAVEVVEGVKEKEIGEAAGEAAWDGELPGSELLRTAIYLPPINGVMYIQAPSVQKASLASLMKMDCPLTLFL